MDSPKPKAPSPAAESLIKQQGLLIKASVRRQHVMRSLMIRLAKQC